MKTKTKKRSSPHFGSISVWNLGFLVVKWVLLAKKLRGPDIFSPFSVKPEGVPSLVPQINVLSVACFLLQLLSRFVSGVEISFFNNLPMFRQVISNVCLPEEILTCPPPKKKYNKFRGCLTLAKDRKIYFLVKSTEFANYVLSRILLL